MKTRSLFFISVLLLCTACGKPKPEDYKPAAPVQELPQEFEIDDELLNESLQDDLEFELDLQMDDEFFDDMIDENFENDFLEPSDDVFLESEDDFSEDFKEFDDLEEILGDL